MASSTELSSSLEEIAQRCREETERFFRRLAPDTRYCYELFRRALAQQDAEAFTRLMTNYAPLVESWVRHQPGFPATREDASYFVTAAFEKLWQAVPPTRFGDFADVKKLLHYLKLCAASSVIDYLRSLDDASSLDDDDRTNLAEPASAEPPLSQVERAELWAEVLLRAQNEQELVVLHACLALQMKPAEVFREYRELFASVREIYRVKQNLIERLRRDQNLRKYLSSYA